MGSLAIRLKSGRKGRLRNCRHSSSPSPWYCACWGSFTWWPLRLTRNLHGSAGSASDFVHGFRGGAFGSVAKHVELVQGPRRHARWRWTKIPASSARMASHRWPRSSSRKSGRSPPWKALWGVGSACQTTCSSTCARCTTYVAMRVYIYIYLHTHIYIYIHTLPPNPNPRDFHRPPCQAPNLIPTLAI